MMVRFSRVGLAAVPMCHPSVVRSRQLMGHDEGNTLNSQDHREGFRALPLKTMECGNCRAFRHGKRRGACPYELLGLKLPTSNWWTLLQMDPKEVEKKLSTQRVAA